MAYKVNHAPFRIVDFVEEANLREVSWNQVFLDNTMKIHGLRHQEAVLYVNKAEDRFRLVVNYYGLAVLVLPPTSSEERLSVVLQVNEFLSNSNFKTGVEVKNYLTDHREQMTQKLERSKQAEKIIKSRRRKAA